ncbi:MAG: hypothetical protein J6D12_05925, partial [Peptostreptococcaceae bacterium]|nr:hypothetical protein [Peptostreptococcaceae bacterium]
MHKMKNKKLLSIFMAGIISYACLNIDNTYANENGNTSDIEIDSSIQEDNTNIDIEIKDIVVNDINNIDNIGLNIKTIGTITNIEENKIYIKDESGEGIVYLENISVNNLNIGDSISIIGNINQIENENSSINVVIVNDVNNIELIIVEETPSEDE